MKTLSTQALSISIYGLPSLYQYLQHHILQAYLYLSVCMCFTSKGRVWAVEECSRPPFERSWQGWIFCCLSCIDENNSTSSSSLLISSQGILNHQLDLLSTPTMFPIPVLCLCVFLSQFLLTVKCHCTLYLQLRISALCYSFFHHCLCFVFASVAFLWLLVSAYHCCPLSSLRSLCFVSSYLSEASDESC